MNIKLLLLILMSLTLLSGCNTEEEIEEPTPIFDPGFPGGDGSADLAIRTVNNFTGTSSDPGVVNLAWEIPSTYIGIDYKVWLYRINGTGEGFVLPDPSKSFNSSRFYLISPDFEAFAGTDYIDRDLLPGGDYTFMALIESDGKYSEASVITVTTASVSSNLTFPDPTDFWTSYDITIGSSPQSSLISYSTMDPGFSAMGLTTGRFVMSDAGNLAYYLDTQNNRVVIYKNNAVGVCDLLEEGSDDRFICDSIYNTSPLTAYAVLGQPSDNSTYSCQDPANPLSNAECLTRPRSVEIIDGKLLVGDDNGRILVWNSLPIYGCYNLEKQVGRPTPTECAASKVIGKAGFDDFSVRDVTVDGDADLACPTDMSMFNGDLYIAEACRNRVVRVPNVLDDNLQICTSDSFKGPLCRFSAVLGQPDLYTTEEFSGVYGTSVNFDFGLNALDDGGAFLRKHFKSPSRIEFDSNGRILIAAYEDFVDNIGSGNLELRSRILIWDDNPMDGGTPECRDATFSLGGCDADYVVGQVGFSGLVSVPLGSNYLDYSFTLMNIDFDVIADSMIVTEAALNTVNLYETIDTQILGIPYNARVANPNGIIDDKNRVLPTFQNLSGVRVNIAKGAAFFHDPLLNRIYRVPIFQTN